MYFHDTEFAQAAFDTLNRKELIKLNLKWKKKTFPLALPIFWGRERESFTKILTIIDSQHLILIILYNFH